MVYGLGFIVGSRIQDLEFCMSVGSRGFTV